VSTQQIHSSLTELAALPSDSSDPVSQAIQRFRESKRIEDQAEYFRTHRLATTCRRESRRMRHAKSTKTVPPITVTSQTSIPINLAQRTRLIRQPSTIVEIPSDQEEPGLPSPPDSQLSKPSIELPSTPPPKSKNRRIAKTKQYNEYNGHLGFSSPPQQPYDRQENERQWYMDDVEVGDVPSSVLRGVEGLWALGC
jgi:hypothetical protein